MNTGGKKHLGGGLRLVYDLPRGSAISGTIRYVRERRTKENSSRPLTLIEGYASRG